MFIPIVNTFFFSLIFILIKFFYIYDSFPYSFSRRLLIRLPVGSLVGLVKIQTLPLYINLYIFLPFKEYSFRFIPLF